MAAAGFLRALLCVAALAQLADANAVGAVRSTAGGPTIAQLPHVFNMSFTLIANGVVKPQGAGGVAGCRAYQGQLPAACTAEQGAVSYDTKDHVNITYAPTAMHAAHFQNASNPLKPAFVKLRVCFSATDTTGRPWRAAGKNVDANVKGQCQFAVSTNGSDKFPVAGGHGVWTVPSTTPDASYFVRALVMCSNTTGNNTFYCGQGMASDPTDINNPYLFLVKKMDSIPPGLLTAVIICACIGPGLLIAYVVLTCFKCKRS